jgi:hypothetical protein
VLKADISLTDMSQPTRHGWRCFLHANEGSMMSIERTPNATERRQHERYVLPHMYTAITVMHADGLRLQRYEGHAYDISESGIRFELDTPLQPGEPVSFQIELPGGGGAVNGTGRIVRLFDEQDDPGPRRMALSIARYATSDDRHRLLRMIGSGQLQRAA